MKIRDERSVAQAGTKVGGNIPVDTVFKGSIGRVSATIGFVTSTFLRTFTGGVDLSAPNHAWGKNVIVRDYQPLDVELVIKGNA